MSNIFGSKLKSLRESHNLSQKELANILNIANSTLSQYESGKRVPSDEIKLQIAQYFGVSTDYLLGNEQYKSKVELTKKDEKDIAKRIEEITQDLENAQVLMLHGEIMDDETRELMKSALSTAVTFSKIAAKEKFTPKKYKK